MTLKNIKNHIALTSCSDISEMMLPYLQPHGMTTFNYYKNYFDGSTIRLSTNREWTEHYFKKNYINTSNTPPLSYFKKTLNYFIWLIDDSPEMLVDSAMNFNIANGISIAVKNKDSIEFFCFATELKNTAIVNFYLNNLDLLHQYCRIFKEKGEGMLKVAEKNKIITNDTIIKANELKKTMIDSSFPVLSNQQHICVQLLLKGRTLKQIAKEMSLSVRTVEAYIKNIKLKMGCKNTIELIVKLMQVWPHVLQTT